VPAITGIAHVELSVRDLDASEAWYIALLGLRRVHDGRNDDRGLRDRALYDPESRIVLALTEHRANPGDAFDARRSGLDHLAFAVAGREALRAWQQRLADLGAEYTPMEERPGGAALTVRDPDGIVLEFIACDAAAAE